VKDKLSFSSRNESDFWSTATHFGRCTKNLNLTYNLYKAAGFVSKEMLDG